MTTHVFIVNEDTFSAHLEYMFAGTSSGKRDTNIALLADIKRVRTGDKVIFYFEGVGFYGIFRIRNNKTPDGRHVIYYDKDNYCNGDLKRKLLYRVLIEPDEVYPNPVSEWEALEKLPDNPRDIIWSLIYRKLKGGRGCSPVTPKESDKLIRLIRGNNVEQIRNVNNLTWRYGKIISASCTRKQYDASQASEILIDEILFRNRRVETYLQAYFTENAGNPNLDNSAFAEICGKSNEIKWLGNEFYCGVGMQKIDVFTITHNHKEEFRVIELKTVIDLGVHKQLERYVKWCCEYLDGVDRNNLQPIIVMPKPDSSKPSELAAVNELRTKTLPSFNKAFEGQCQSVKYYEFYFTDKRIKFDAVDYL